MKVPKTAHHGDTENTENPVGRELRTLRGIGTKEAVYSQIPTRSLPLLGSVFEWPRREKRPSPDLAVLHWDRGRLARSEHRRCD